MFTNYKYEKVMNYLNKELGVDKVLMDSLNKLKEQGEVILIGGAIKDVAFLNKTPKDYDIILIADKIDIEFLDKTLFNVEINSFGNYKIKYKQIEIDLFNIECKSYISIEASDFNTDLLYINLSRNTYEAGWFNQSVVSGEITETENGKKHPNPHRRKDRLKSAQKLINLIRNQRVDIMTDIETLGKESDSTVFQISALSFDIKTGEILDEFNQIIDIEKEQMKVDGNTIKWWLNTNHNLMKELILNKNSKPSKDVIKNFYEWISIQSYDIKNVYLWGNGILFDNKMIQTQMKKHEYAYPIFYRNDRDLRTLLDLASHKSKLSEKELKSLVKDKSETEHNALDDCKFQIRLACECYKILIQ